MTCSKCGSPSQGHLCQPCERMDRSEEKATHWTAGESILAQLEKQEEEEAE